MSKLAQPTVVDKLRQHTNFEVVETIQDNERYLLCEIEQNSQTRILKIANDPELIPNLLREVENNLFLSTVSQYRSNNHIEVRNIHSHGKGWYIGDHFDGPLLFNSQPIKKMDTSVAKASQHLAQLFAEIESYTPAGLFGLPVYTDKHGRPTVQFRERWHEIEQHKDIACRGGFLTEASARRITDYIHQHKDSVTSALELWDLEPWELFYLGGERIGLIDVEYMNLRGRRYFDIVWNYHRLWADLKSPAAAKQFLKSYLERKEVDQHEFTRPFLVQFGMKLIGYLRDAALWLEDTRAYGAPLVYTPEEMEDLLERYLRFEVSALTD